MNEPFPAGELLEIDVSTGAITVDGAPIALRLAQPLCRAIEHLELIAPGRGAHIHEEMVRLAWEVAQSPSP